MTSKVTKQNLKRKSKVTKWSKYYRTVSINPFKDNFVVETFSTDKIADYCQNSDETVTYCI